MSLFPLPAFAGQGLDVFERGVSSGSNPYRQVHVFDDTDHVITTTDVRKKIAHATRGASVATLRLHNRGGSRFTARSIRGSTPLPRR